jgi:hypothetical protein
MSCVCVCVNKAYKHTYIYRGIHTCITYVSIHAAYVYIHTTCGWVMDQEWSRPVVINFSLV